MLRFKVASFFLVAGAALVASTASGALTPPTTPIGDAPNDPDPANHRGQVPYVYFIGVYEVTAGEYTAFLNSVAASDTHDLYSQSQASTLTGCGIFRAGSDGNYSYSVSPNFANRPVTFVSFWDAVRFANWMHNGQPTGPQDNTTTEDGAYTLTEARISNNSVQRNDGWLWAVTSDAEWYKAAYHQPLSEGGPFGNYWNYPTSRSTISTLEANYNGVIGATTPVGSYSANYYGTFDMAGNVYEWTDGQISGRYRGLRGGSFPYLMPTKNGGSYYFPTLEDGDTGFRVVHFCIADRNEDGVVDLGDFFDFLNCFDPTDTCADMTGEGVVDLADFFAFLNAFDQSC